MDAKNLNSAMKGMKLKSWEIREDSTGKRKLYVRTSPPFPMSKRRPPAGRSALHEGVDGKPSTTEHMKWMRIAFSRKVRTTPFLGSLATCKRHCEALGFTLGKWRSRTCRTRETRRTMVSENCHSAKQA